MLKGLVAKAYNFFSSKEPHQLGDGSYFYSSELKINTWGEIDPLDSFISVPELNAIINLKARAFSNGVFKVVDKSGKPVAHPLLTLLDNPNWMQAGKEFMRQTKLFHDIFGDEYLYMLFPVGFTPDRVKALYTIPPNFICVEANITQPFFAYAETPDIKYKLLYSGDTYLSADTIIQLNDNRVCTDSLDSKYILKGESKMQGMKAAINNLKMAYESRGIILKHRGALGILSNANTDVGGSIALKPEEIDKIQQDYKNKYGGLDGQHQVIITNQNLKWQQMSVSPDKLGLFQETEEDFNKLLDGYGVPSEMFVRNLGATYENQKQARKGFYEGTVIPEANEWVHALNRVFFPDDKLKLIVDYMHLPVFQEDIKIKNEAQQQRVNLLSRLLQDQAITLDEYRSELGKMGIGDGKPLPTVQDENQQNAQTLAAQAALRGSVGGVQGVLGVQASVVAGTTTYDSAISILTIIYGFTDQQAREILGKPTTNIL